MKDKASPNEPVTDKMFGKKNSVKSLKAFAITCTIITILLLGTIIYGYLRVSKLNNQLQDQKIQITELSDSKKSLEDAASAAASAATTAAANAVSNAVANAGFVEVTELGFKLPVSADLKDLQYFVNEKTVFFSTKSLMSSAWAADSSDPGKYCSPGVLPLGAITSFTTAAEAGPAQQKALTGFVLGYAPAQANCSNSATTTILQNKQKAELLKAFESAQKI